MTNFSVATTNDPIHLDPQVIQAMLRLVSDVQRLRSSHSQSRDFYQPMLTSIGRLVDCSVAQCFVIENLMLGMDCHCEIKSQVVLSKNGTGEESQKPPCGTYGIQPCHTVMHRLVLPDTVVTLTDQALRQDQGEAENIPADQTFIWSFRPTVRPGRYNLLTFHRMTNTPAFGEKERIIVHLLHSELGTSHVDRETAGATNDSAAPKTDKLRFREKQVLGHLLEGLSEKQIANALSLSPYTVHEYVKNLYRHFDVSSRAELMANFIKQP